MEAKEGNGFASGFVTGAAIGAGAVFFLGTKTGKRLLKIITEEGFNAATLVGEVVKTYKESDEHDEKQIKKTSPSSTSKKIFKGAPKH